MESLGPKGYQTNALQAFAAAVNTRGKRILEIGGSNIPFETISSLIAPAQWVAVDLIPAETLSLLYTSDDPYIVHLRQYGVYDLRRDMAALDREYVIFANAVLDLSGIVRERFDLIFSVASFEHIHGLRSAVSVMYDALVPGGILWTRFSPIWSSTEGYHFSNNTTKIPPWAHLLWPRRQMREHLLSQGMSDAEASRWLYRIYEQGYINRLFFDDYEEIMAASPFDAKLRGIWPVTLPQEIAVELINSHHGRRGFEFQGIEIIGSKALAPAPQ